MEGGERWDGGRGRCAGNARIGSHPGRFMRTVVPMGFVPLAACYPSWIFAVACSSSVVFWGRVRCVVWRCGVLRSVVSATAVGSATAGVVFASKLAVAVFFSSYCYGDVFVSRLAVVVFCYTQLLSLLLPSEKF